MSTLNDYKSFLELAKAPAGKRLITLKWVYKIKFKNGVFDKFKARLVGRGFTQIAGVDYDPEGTSSPVARNSTFMATMAEVTAMQHFLYSFDVKSAYLLADLTDEVYACVRGEGGRGGGRRRRRGGTTANSSALIFRTARGATNATWFSCG